MRPSAPLSLFLSRSYTKSELFTYTMQDCGPTCAQCPLITTNDDAVITEPFTADDIETAVNKLSPRSTQSTKRAAMSPMINALANATVASVMATVEDDTEVTVPRRTTRSQSTRLNLAATFEGFVPANNPNAWRDRDLE